MGRFFRSSLRTSINAGLRGYLTAQTFCGLRHSPRRKYRMRPLHAGQKAHLCYSLTFTPSPAIFGDKHPPMLTRQHRKSGVMHKLTRRSSTLRWWYFSYLGCYYPRPSSASRFSRSCCASLGSVGKYSGPDPVANGIPTIKTNGAMIRSITHRREK